MESAGQLCYLRSGAFSNKFYSVDAQWITAKKDWEESKRRHNLQRQNGFTDSSSGPKTGQATNEAVYDKDMDASRCILYLHGGENFLFVMIKVETNIQQEDTTLEA